MPEPVHNVEGLNCPNCGAPQTLRAFGHTLTVVCPNCHSILDAKDPKLQVLQKFEVRQRIQPLIPLGQRGRLRGADWETIGFQVRSTTSDGITYSWREYVLFNPYKGFRYLTEYDGHWNDVQIVDAVPERGASGARPFVTYLGERYFHFQTGRATTSYVLGEFPWQVRVHDEVKYRDFVAPPRVLSEEITQGEVTWSLGEYMTGARVFEAFKLPGTPPPAIGIFENQPAPKGQLRGMWVACAFLLLALCVLALGVASFAHGDQVFHAAYVFEPNPAPFVTDPFELKGHAADVEVETHAPPDVPVYMHYALIGVESGHAWDFARQVEGGRDSAIVPTVPAGHYYLRIEPEAGTYTPGAGYEVRVRHDVPAAAFYWLAGLFILVPPLARTILAGRFESRRWKESDYASG